MPPKSGSKKLRKRKKPVLSLNKKIEMCSCLEMGVNRKVVMKKFNVSSSTLSTISAQKEELLNFFATGDSNRIGCVRFTAHKGKLHNLEEALFEWYTAVRSEVSTVTGSMITEKAKHLYKQMQIKEPCTFSTGWLTRFKFRYGIRRVDAGRMEVMKEPVFCGASQIYREFFGTLVAEHDLTSELIYSACETKLFWRALHDSSQSCVKNTKKDYLMGVQEMMTVMLCANASGRHKLNVFAVGEDELESSRRNLDSSVVYNVRSDGVMDKELYVQWFEEVFVQSVKFYLKNSGKPEDSKVLLLLDNCAQEILNTELVYGNIFAVFLPNDVTSVILPMNQGVIHDFKCNYRIDVMKKLSRREMSVQYFLSQYSISDVMVYLKNAWDSVNMKVLGKSWHHLLPSSLLKESCEEGLIESSERKDNPDDNKVLYEGFPSTSGVDEVPS